jgi:DNA-binding protein HU-beta
LTNKAKTSINIFVGKILASVDLDKNYNIQRRNFNMNKAELVSAMAEKTELSKKDAEAALKAFTDVVAEELKKGEKIQLVGFGTFEVSERAARTGRNPQTGAEMTIPASKAPKFKAGKALKDMINA